MNIGFSQTAEHCMNRTDRNALCSRLPGAILGHTSLDYFCQPTEKGCLLKPTFQNMLYGNSFVPEIDIVISGQDDKTVLQMTGRPVKFVRVFMKIWFGFLAFMEACGLLITVSSGVSSFPFLFIPVIMCVFGYLLCKIATKLTFRTVVNAIRQEFF